MDPVIDLALRGGLALLFVVAALHKTRDLGTFHATLANYRLLPPRGTWPAAVIVVGGEVMAAMSLLFAPATGVLVATTLLAGYTGAIAVNLARGRRDIDCGCAGPAHRQPLRPWLLVRNAVLIAAALACVAPGRARPLVWIDVLTVAGTIGVLAMLYAAVERLASLRALT
jgi:methylamine utilization protein MauE